MRYAILRWIVDKWVGGLLVEMYKMEIERGNAHEALHCLGAVVHGNSEWCGEKCYEEWHGYTVELYLKDIEKRGLE